MASEPEVKAASTPQPMSNGTSGSANGTAQQPAAPASDSKPRISNAELKKQAKAEKAVKRAAAKAAAGVAPGAGDGSPGPSSAQGQPPPGGAGPKSILKKPSQSQQGQIQQQQRQKQGQRQSRAEGGAQGAAAAVAMPHSKSISKAEAVPNNRNFKQFQIHRRTGIEGAHKDVHPAVLAFGLQVSNYQICGSTARCIGMLQAFKAVIKSYVIPRDNALARHFIPHVLSPQIEFIKSCRPISIGMGNAIRDLKDAIVKIDPETSEREAKHALYDVIDTFMRERITAADALIAVAAADKIVDGDVILTFARSSIIERTLRETHKAGRRFRVIVVDSKPLYEGRRLAASLAACDIQTDYYLISGIAHALEEATKVLVGAHAMMGDGRLYSRIGTAVVGMLAKQANKPMIVCCESYKFTDRVYVDSFGGNELAPPEELLEDATEREAWRQQMEKRPLLQMLNLLYDLTPAEYVNMIVTEHGNLPPSSVPAVLRMLEGKSA